MLFPNDSLAHIEKSNKYIVQEFYFTEVHLLNIIQYRGNISGPPLVAGISGKP
jgi:hypothetical protein